MLARLMCLVQHQGVGMPVGQDMVHAPGLLTPHAAVSWPGSWACLGLTPADLHVWHSQLKRHHACGARCGSPQLSQNELTAVRAGMSLAHNPSCPSCRDLTDAVQWACAAQLMLLQVCALAACPEQGQMLTLLLTDRASGAETCNQSGAPLVQHLAMQ